MAIKEQASSLQLLCTTIKESAVPLLLVCTTIRESAPPHPTTPLYDDPHGTGKIINRTTTPTELLSTTTTYLSLKQLHDCWLYHTFQAGRYIGQCARTSTNFPNFVILGSSTQQMLQVFYENDLIPIRKLNNFKTNSPFTIAAKLFSPANIYTF